MNIEHTNHAGHRLIVDSTAFRKQEGHDPERYEVRDWVFFYDHGIMGRERFHPQPGSTYEQAIKQLFKWFRNWNVSPELVFTVDTMGTPKGL